MRRVALFLGVLAPLSWGMPAHEMAVPNEGRELILEARLQRARNPRTLIFAPREWTPASQLLHSKIERFPVPENRGSDSLFMTVDGESLYDNLILVHNNEPHKNGAVKMKAVSTEIIDWLKKHNGNLLIFGVPTNKSPSIAGEILSWLGFKANSRPFYDNNNHNENNCSFPLLDLPSIFSAELIKHHCIANQKAHLLRIPKDNVLIFPLTETKTINENISGPLVSLQTRTNSRLVISTSQNLCEQGFVQDDKLKELFCQDLYDWTFQRKAVIEWSNLKHQKVIHSPDSEYRLGDLIDFSINLFELKNVENEFKFDSLHLENEVQLEFTKIDPYLRIFLLPTPSNDTVGSYGARFRIPDTHGIFKFVVRLKKQGYSFLHVESLIPVAPLRRSDKPRFNFYSLPYYTSIFITLITTSIAVIAFVNQKE